MICVSAVMAIASITLTRSFLRWRRERNIGPLWVLHSSVPPVVTVGYGIARPPPSRSRSSSESSYR